MDQKELESVLAEMGYEDPKKKAKPDPVPFGRERVLYKRKYSDNRELRLSRYTMKGKDVFSIRVWARSGWAERPWEPVQTLTFTRQAAPEFIKCMRHLESMLVSGVR